MAPPAPGNPPAIKTPGKGPAGPIPFDFRTVAPRTTAAPAAVASGFDAHRNLAVSSVAIAPDPATIGTVLFVTAGTGRLYPVAPFNVTICPANTQPTIANAEIARVTIVEGDRLTIVRAQEDSTARAIQAGDLIAATITAKTITDIEKVARAATYRFDAGTTVWTVPDGARKVEVICVGAGGGGGGGGQLSTGGPGGGGGAVARAVFRASDLPATIAITAGAGGAGGAGNAGAGANGVNGGGSSFGTLLKAGGGGGADKAGTSNPGAGGGTASDAVLGTPGAPAAGGAAIAGQGAIGASGGVGRASEWGGASGGGYTSAFGGGDSIYGGPGGGAGGAAGVAGGAGGGNQLYASGGGAAGTAGGPTPATPAAGAAGPAPYCGQGGGGAGGSNGSNNGGTGGAGGSGAGGGGGGSSSSGSGGPGGKGGDGYVLVIVSF